MENEHYRLVRWYIDCGRMGTLESKLLLDAGDWERLQQACLKRERFVLYDVLGKHSEIEYVFDNADFTVVTEDQHFLSLARQLDIDLTSGPVNPLDELENREEEE